MPIQQTARLLLDVVAAEVVGAYGLRKLRAAYAGTAVRVQRGADDAEKDINFDPANALDGAALVAFVRAGDRFAAR